MALNVLEERMRGARFSILSALEALCVAERAPFPN